MRDDERSLLPLRPPLIARVGAPSRLITRGVERLQRAERRCIELPTPTGAISRAHAINNRGQIAGFVRWPDEELRADSWEIAQMTTTTQAVIWEHGQMTALETTEGMQSQAFDINDYGQIVGAEYLVESGGELDEFLCESVAVLWQDGRKIDLEDHSARRDSQANAVNNKGQIVGATSLGDRDGHVNAVLWHNGNRTVLETLERYAINSEYEADGDSFWEVLGPYDGAFGINDQGIIVGISHTKAVVWESGKVSELDQVGSYRAWESDAHDINERGQIVGTFWPNPYEPPDWNGPPQSILWHDCLVHELAPTCESIDEPSPWRRQSMLAINNLGQVVGLQSSVNPNVAWLWDGRHMIELANPTSAWAYASDINDRGVVVGNCDYGDGVWRACQWE